MKPGDIVLVTRMIDDEGIVPGDKIIGTVISVRSSRWSDVWKWCILLEPDGRMREHMFSPNTIEVVCSHEQDEDTAEG